MAKFIVRNIDSTAVYHITSGSHADARAKADAEIRRCCEATRTDGKKISSTKWTEDNNGNWIVELLDNSGNISDTTRYSISLKLYMPSIPGEGTTVTIKDPDAPATAAQWSYLRRLGDRVGPTTRRMWIKDTMTKGQAHLAICNLETMADKS